MANPKFIIEVPGLAEMNIKLAGASGTVHKTLEAAVKASMIVMQTIAKSEAPVRTSKLRGAISFESSGLQGVVYPDLVRTPYAAYVHEGSGLYGKFKRPIVPKSKHVLATKVNPGWGTPNRKGYYIIGKSIKGQKPNPFMQRAFDKGKSKVMTIMEEAMDAAAKEIL